MLNEVVERNDEAFDEKENSNRNNNNNNNEHITDGWNIASLFFLYLLQGIPLGLSAAIPLILQKKNISYKDQAGFSFAGWPFSMKLLWAPIVDAIFYSKFGRRKSWLIPAQYLIGIFMLFISMNVDDWLGDDTGTRQPKIKLLAIMFFACNFLAATQDIAVDGWALTMLHRENVGHASTCNSIGQTAGFFFGYVLFIALDSPDFCNRFLRFTPEPTGLVSFSSFMYFWALVYLVSTTLVAIFKKDNSLSIVENEKELAMNLKQSYQLLLDILKLKPVQWMALLLLTCRIGFAACDAVSNLKLIDAGVPKDKLVLMAVPLIPFQIILPFLISRHIVGPRPLNIFMGLIPYRLLIGLTMAVFVYITPNFKFNAGFPLSYYFVLLLICGLRSMVAYSMFVSVMAFFAKVSDPRFGGTYMTLLNTLLNLGGTGSHTIMLLLIDILTFKKCQIVCEPAKTQLPCTLRNICSIIVDGYYVEIIICTITGFLWLQWSKKHVKRLQNLDKSAWLVNTAVSSEVRSGEKEVSLFQTEVSTIPDATDVV